MSAWEATQGAPGRLDMWDSIRRLTFALYPRPESVARRLHDAGNKQLGGFVFVTDDATRDA